MSRTKGAKSKKPNKRGADRKPHAFKEQNENGKNATRPIEYTEAVVEKLMEDMLQALRDDRRKVHTTAGKTGLSVEVGFEFVYIGELFHKFDLINSQVSTFLSNYPENKKISAAYTKIKEMFGDRAWAEGLRGNLNSTIVKFHLINNYGAKDLSAIDHGGAIDHNLLMRDIIRRSKEKGAQ